MKAQDVILQLKAALPPLTDRFSDPVQILSMTRSGTTVTVQTQSAHNVLTGDVINIDGAAAPIFVDTITLQAQLSGDFLVTITTLQDHDVTYNEQEDLDQPTIELFGANEAIWNTTFTVNREPPNRRTIELILDSSFSTPPTGTILLDDKAPFSRGYTGLIQIGSVTNSTTFTYETSLEPTTPAIVENAILYTANRISGAVTFDRAERAYTQLTQSATRDDDKFWCFVVLGGTVANKDRSDPTDAQATRNRADDYRQRILSEFQLFIFVPTTDDFAGGRDARDEMQDIRLFIFQSLLGVSFDDGLCEQPFSVTTYLDDSLFADRDSYIVHQFSFQTANDITFGDINQNYGDCAFRDINIDFLPDKPDLTFIQDINLDDEALTP